MLLSFRSYTAYTDRIIEPSQPAVLFDIESPVGFRLSLPPLCCNVTILVKIICVFPPLMLAVGRSERVLQEFKVASSTVSVAISRRDLLQGRRGCNLREN